MGGALGALHRRDREGRQIVGSSHQPHRGCVLGPAGSCVAELVLDSCPRVSVPGWLRLCMAAALGHRI